MQIFSFWDRGRGHAPRIVQDCFSRWEDLNPGCTLTVLQNEDLPGLLGDFPFDISLLPVQARADILRIRLLRQYGGIWTDATVLPVLPLAMWHERYVAPGGFFVYCASAEHWRFTNFLILSRPGNHFIAMLDERIRQYWTHPRRIVDQTPGRLQPRSRIGKRLLLHALGRRDMGLAYIRFYEKWRRDLLYLVLEEGAASEFFPYFWEQYLMMELVRTDPLAAEIIRQMPYRLHDHCHMLQSARNSLGEDFSRAVPMALLSAPIQKLDWRREWPDEILAMPDPGQVLV